MNGARRAPHAFTLVELVVSMSVLVILMALFLLALQGIQRIWSTGDQRVENYQNGRAILDLMARELSGAVVSNRYQLVQTPDLSKLVTSAPLPAANSHSLFWVGPAAAAADPTAANKDIMAEFGYYLARDDASGVYELRRFFVTPGNTDYKASSVVATRTAADWLNATGVPAFQSSSPDVSVVSSGVIALWIRCFDFAGNPVPWLGVTGSPLFNSATAFQMTNTDGAYSPGPPPVTFQYLDNTTPPSTPNPPLVPCSNRLPESFEITIISLDSRTLARRPSIPSMAPASTPADIPQQIAAFQDALLAANIKSAATFTVRVHLANSYL